MEQTHITGRLQIILYSLVCLLRLGVASALAQAGDTPRQGDTLRVAAFEPPSLDGLWTKSAGPLVRHYLEGLYTLGQDYGLTPMLATGHTVSNDGLVYTFTLRRGVLFHHGKELTATDAVASLQRWGKVHLFGKDFFHARRGGHAPRQIPPPDTSARADRAVAPCPCVWRDYWRAHLSEGRAGRGGG